MEIYCKVRGCSGDALLRILEDATRGLKREGQLQLDDDHCQSRDCGCRGFKRDKVRRVQ